jgi:hypothetical protein
VPLDKAVLAVSTTGATDDKPDPATARSGRAKAIIAPSRWYKKSVRAHTPGRKEGHLMKFPNGSLSRVGYLVAFFSTVSSISLPFVSSIQAL